VLLAHIPTADEEQLEQIFLVLEDLYVSSDPMIADAAELALEELANDSRRDVRRSIEELFQANYSRRHLRACARIEEFGGKLLSSPYALRGSDIPFASDLAVIDADWTGGEDGLKYLTRIQGLASVHVAENAPVSPKAVSELARNHNLNLRHENEACLGVELREGSRRMIIRQLAAKSPAYRAGLEPADEVVELAGVPVENFREFITELRSHRPGTVVDLKVIRDEAEVMLRVELGSDFGTGRCRCEGDDNSDDDLGPDSEPFADRPLRYPPSSDRAGPASHDGTRLRHHFNSQLPATHRAPP